MVTIKIGRYGIGQPIVYILNPVITKSLNQNKTCEAFRHFVIGI